MSYVYSSNLNNKYVNYHQTDLSVQSSILDNKLEEFRISYCPGIDKKFMEYKIDQGQKLLKLVASHEYDTPNWNIFTRDYGTEENAVAIIWALTQQAISQDDAYTKGSMRLYNAKDPHFAKKMENFLKHCGNSYPRISTHMNENLMKGESAFGLDLPNKGLPAQQGTILFVRQPDESIFIKMERAGFPGFGSLSNAMISIHHSINYLQTRFTKAPNKARGEHVPREVKHAYKKVMDRLFGTQNWCEYLCGGFFTNDNIKTKKSLYRAGATYGISMMCDIVHTVKNPATTKNMPLVKKKAFQTAVSEFESIAKPYLEGAKQRGYKKDFKGKEVLITLRH